MNVCDNVDINVNICDVDIVKRNGLSNENVNICDVNVNICDVDIDVDIDIVGRNGLSSEITLKSVSIPLEGRQVNPFDYEMNTNNNEMLCTVIKEEKVLDYLASVIDDSEHIKYFKEMGISPIIVDSGATCNTFTDTMLFDNLKQNFNENITVSMGSRQNTKMIDGIGSNFLFSRINYVTNLMWNLISLGSLTSYPLTWTFKGNGVL